MPIDSSKVKRAAAVGYKLHVMVDNEQQLDALLEEEGANWSIVVMVDCGYGRDGVDVNSAEGVALVRRIVKDDRLKLKSLYTHGTRAHERTSGRADERTSGRADERTSGRADERTSGRADERTSGRADQRTSAQLVLSREQL